MSMELQLIHSEARLSAAKCCDGSLTYHGDLGGWRPLNKENLGSILEGKDIIIGWAWLLSRGSVADHCSGGAL
jgi:hypothetical protein